MRGGGGGGGRIGRKTNTEYMKIDCYNRIIIALLWVFSAASLIFALLT